VNRRMRSALRQLARGSACYSTMTTEMMELQRMGLVYAHCKKASDPIICGGKGNMPGRWTWRPTEAGRAAICEMGASND
jgi:hypothetical protein